MARQKVKFRFSEGAPVKSVESFLAQIRQFAGSESSRIFFRGHGQPTSGLGPSIGREHHYLGRSLTFDPQVERKFLKQFRRYAYEHFGRMPNEWENLFLARHHGLPTRLLDWTSNPLVALYFAAFYEHDAAIADGEAQGNARLRLPGTIWAIQQGSDIDELDIFNERRPPLEIPGIKLVHPFNPTPRMTAQSGYFTLHGDPWVDMVSEAGKDYRPRDLDIIKLIRWPIPERNKTTIILELERLAINSRTLFPDLEGLALGLWHTEMIEQCFVKPRRREAVE
jgi:hypothetical protein